MKLYFEDEDGNDAPGGGSMSNLFGHAQIRYDIVSVALGLDEHFNDEITFIVRPSENTE